MNKHLSNDKTFFLPRHAHSRYSIIVSCIEMKASHSSNMRPSGTLQKVPLDSSYVNTAKNSGHFWSDSPSKDFNVWVKTSLWEQAGPQSSEFLLWPEVSSLRIIPFVHSLILSFIHSTNLFFFTYYILAVCYVLGTQRWERWYLPFTSCHSRGLTEEEALLLGLNIWMQVQDHRVSEDNYGWRQPWRPPLHTHGHRVHTQTHSVAELELGE